MRPPLSAHTHADHARKDSLVLPGFAIVLYLSLALVLFREILKRNGGHFTYALDDPYIHLALSEGIAHGHYGINAGEAASPSSSAIWPFLLAMFARYSWQVYVPLALNLLAGVATAALIGVVVAQWPAPSLREDDNAERWRRWLSVAGLVFIANLLGLTFIGMEHTLQVFLAGVGAWGILCCLRGRPVPAWVLVCVALAPLVRYEGLAVSAGLAIALAGQHRLKRAAALLVGSVLPLLVFSLFLHHLGLPWVPTSVLVKGQSRIAVADAVLHRGKGSSKAAIAPGTTVPAEGNGEPGVHAPESSPTPASGSALETNPDDKPFIEPHRLLLTILVFTLFGVAWYEPLRERRFALFGATAVGGLHLLIGRFHWFHRYEVYAVFFSALVVLYVVHERARGLLGWYVLGLLGCSCVYVQAFYEVPRSAGDVYREEFQMHRFTTEFYTGNVGVNDLGWVSYHRRPGTYVLDLWGLGSVETARQHDKSTAWLDAVTRAHHIDLVMNYALWFAPPPRDWTLLGEVCLNQMPVALGDPCVNYYATTPAATPALQAEFNSFAATLPPGIVVRHPFLPPPPIVPAP